MSDQFVSLDWIALAMLGLIAIVSACAVWALLSRSSAAETQANSILTRNRELSRQIQSANQDLAQIFEAIQIPLVILQCNPFLIRAVNGACIHFLGCSVEGQAREKLEGLLYPSDESTPVLANLRRLIARDVSFPVELKDFFPSLPGNNSEKLLPVAISLRPIKQQFSREYVVALSEDSGGSDQERLLKECHRLIDSTLKEKNLPDALQAVSRLCERITESSASIGITTFDDRTNLLRFVVEPAKLREDARESVNNINVVFGNGAHATAALLKKEANADLHEDREFVPDNMRTLLIKSSVRRWTSLPILAMNGQLLGTLDFFFSAESADGRMEFEKLAPSLHLAGVAIERNKSILALEDNARFEQFLRFFNQQLMTSPHRPDDSAFVDAISKIITFLKIPPSSLQCWMLQEKSDVYLPVGATSQERESGTALELAGGEVRRLLTNDELLIHKSEYEASLASEYQFLHLSTDHKLARSLRMSPVVNASTDQGMTQQLLVFPLSADARLEGFLVFSPQESRQDRQLRLISTIAPVLASALARHRLIESLMHKALHDRLTGLFNRNKIEEVLQHELDRSQRYDNPLSILLFDVDNFKIINDNFGHDVGDRVLRELSVLVSQKLRAADLIGRWGGEEFIVVLTETPLDKAIGVANTIRRDVEANNFGLHQSLTISIGVAEYIAGDTKNSLIKRSDIALYQAKSSGRNNVVPSVSQASRV